MAVGIKQLEEVFRQAREFDSNPSALNLDELRRDLAGVLDDFRNLRGNDARLIEMDNKLYELVQLVDFEHPGLRSLIAHFLATLFENYANEGRGFRKAYDLSQEKRQVSTIDGPFIYEELTPAIFDEGILHDADSLRFFLLGEVTKFLEDKDPGGHWSHTLDLEKVKKARFDTVLLELARRWVRFHDKHPNLAQTPHTLEQRLAEDGFFKNAATVRRVMAYFFDQYGYIERRSWWERFRKWLRKLISRGGGTGLRLGRWKKYYRLQISYIVLAVVLSIAMIVVWNWRQIVQLENLEKYYNEVSNVSGEG